MIILYIGIGIIVGACLLYSILNTIKDFKRINQIKVEEEELNNYNRQFKCPDCYNTDLLYDYVNPLFKTGRYATCKICGLSFDAPEDDDGKNFEMELYH